MGNVFCGHKNSSVTGIPSPPSKVPDYTEYALGKFITSGCVAISSVSETNQLWL